MSDLNRRIAEVLGWSDIHEGSYWWEGYDTGPREVHVLIGRDPNTHDDRPLPNWSGDLNAAISLLAGQRFSYEHYPDGAPHDQRVTDRVLIYEYSRIIGEGGATSAPEAFVLAWLAWKGQGDG